MEDLLLVVEEYLDGEGIAHYRDDAERVCFGLPFGHTSYDCRIHDDEQMLVLFAHWKGQVEPDQIEWAEQVLLRLIEISASSGKTYFNRVRGTVAYRTSVDVSMVNLTDEKVATIVETLLDPFNIEILAMQSVLNGDMPADGAVECYAQWNRDRIAKMMQPFRDGDNIDPSSN